MAVAEIFMAVFGLTGYSSPQTFSFPEDLVLESPSQSTLTPVVIQSDDSKYLSADDTQTALFSNYHPNTKFTLPPAHISSWMSNWHLKLDMSEANHWSFSFSQNLLFPWSAIPQFTYSMRKFGIIFDPLFLGHHTLIQQTITLSIPSNSS